MGTAVTDPLIRFCSELLANKGNDRDAKTPYAISLLK